MSRIDAKRGRFNPDFETDQMLGAMAGWAEVDGDWLNYFRFDPGRSAADDVYDEATGDGEKFLAPVRVQCLHVTHSDGAAEISDNGFYFNDDLDATIAFDAFTEAGMSMADLRTGNYLRDRVIYDRKVFRVKQLAVRGQMQERDLVIALTAVQLKPDELVQDVMFRDWAPGGPYTLDGGTQ